MIQPDPPMVPFLENPRPSLPKDTATQVTIPRNSDVALPSPCDSVEEDRAWSDFIAMMDGTEI